MLAQWTLDDVDARLAVDAIYAELKTRGKTAVIAVVDAHGELLSLQRVSGTLLSSMTVATNKAFTAARLRRLSSVVGKRSRDPVTGFDIGYYGDSRYVGWGGGVPVEREGQVVGAVGVSGLSESEDEELAQIGVAAITRRVA